ncbi:MAG: hypothetical protein AAF211_23935, partial [Myxococcota bacterium]
MTGWWLRMWLVWAVSWVASPALAQTVGVIVPEGDNFTRTVDLFEADHPGVQIQPVADAQAAIDAGVVAVVAHSADDAAATATADALKAAKIPFVASNATSRAIAQSGSHVFVADTTDDRRAEHIVAYLKAVTGATSVALAHASDQKAYADLVAAKAKAITAPVMK